MTHDVLTVQEVAAYLRVTTKTVRNMIAKGEIRAARVGGQWRVAAVAFDEYRSAVGLTPAPRAAILPLPDPEPECDDEALGRRLLARRRSR